MEQKGGALPTQETECAIGRPSSQCLLRGELDELASIAKKFGSTVGGGKKILDVLMKETKCESEECVICEMLAKVKGTPYESIVRRIKELAFKPKGPYELTALLDSFMLVHIGLQIEAGYEGIKFGGALAYDFMIPPIISSFGSPKAVAESHRKEKWKKLQFLLNIDHRMGTGLHWVALCINTSDGQIEYTDSYGQPPMGGLIRSSRPYPGITNSSGQYLSLIDEWIRDVQTEFIKGGVPMKFVYNRTRHQEDRDHSNCGVYAVVALVASAENRSFIRQNSQSISMVEISAIRERLYRRTPGYIAELPSIALDH
jgi:hypothetical protein